MPLRLDDDAVNRTVSAVRHVERQVQNPAGHRGRWSGMGSRRRRIELKTSLTAGGANVGEVLNSATAYIRRWDRATSRLVTDTTRAPFTVYDDLGTRSGIGLDAVDAAGGAGSGSGSGSGWGTGDEYAHGSFGKAEKFPDDPNWYFYDLQQEDLLVTVEKDGGVGGGTGVNCSWTYTVINDGGVEIAIGVTPQRARIAAVTYLEGAAGGRSSYGFARYVGGSLVLLDVFGEVLDPTVCS